MKRNKIVAGNWKMHFGSKEAGEFAESLRNNLLDTHGVSVILCPPFLALKTVFDTVSGSELKVGAQNMHWEEAGAFTGEITGAMIRETGAEYVILGHSERRHVFGESDEWVNKKVHRSLKTGLIPIFCVGEKIEEREAEETEKVIARQLRVGLKNLSDTDMDTVIIAYEPVWAIGTGLTASPEQAAAIHTFIRGALKTLFNENVAESTWILYGGSVKPDNTIGLLSNKDIDGALVGGASMQLESFKGIIDEAGAIK
ncbi:MAG: triose-phosphate isomerase [Candidatus Marinimicrobia bacterium]|nr:triose-phosphate isomerase [Candidatus Neomarinimicrobiota bacterium]